MNNFLIGIGSQRAGSTLLHRLIQTCTNVYMHPVKELHYFDTYHKVRNPEILKEYSQKQVHREVNKIISSNDFSFIDNNFKCFLRANKILSNNNVESIEYIDLYRPCLKDNTLLGEITPEYMILPEAGISHMCDVIGKGAQIVLLTRDPFDRFVSAFKLLKSYNGGHYNKENISEEICKTIDEMPDWIAQQIQLNDYDNAEAKYRKYFDNVTVIAYEDMVTNPSYIHEKIESIISDKVSISQVERLLGSKVNNIGETGELDNSAIGYIKKNLGIL